MRRQLVHRNSLAQQCDDSRRLPRLRWQLPAPSAQRPAPNGMSTSKPALTGSLHPCGTWSMPGASEPHDTAICAPLVDRFAIWMLPVFVDSSCGGCDKKSCVEPGVYLTLGLEPRAASAVICIDTDCKTLPVKRSDGLTGSDQQYSLRIDDPVTWAPGRRVSISIDVRDASGASLAKTLEHRTMISLAGNACSPCPAFMYNLSEGRVQRTDRA
jgi:hypothetical protein